MSDTASTVDPNGLNLAPTLGPLYWGFLLSLVLTGINVLQGFVYFPSRDKASVRLVAVVMLLLNIASSALVAQSMFYYLIPHFGSLVPLKAITSELSVECLISTTITLISQGYFVVLLWSAARLRKQSLLIPITIGVFAILAFVGGTACTTVMIIHDHSVLTNRAEAFSIFFGLAKGFGAMTDIAATAAMCVFLEDARTQMSGTKSLAVKSLIQYIVRRGILVTLIQTLLLVTFHAAPSHLYWLAFHVNVTKLYANTFFSMLNGREQSTQHRTRGSISGQSTLAGHSFSLKDKYRSGTRNSVQWRSAESEENGVEVEIQGRGYGSSEAKSYGFPVVGAGHGPMPTVTKTVVIAEL